jgi:D-aminopeptidase
MDPIFTAAVEATEESIINALVAAETMTGIDSKTVHALPHDRVLQIMKKYGR